MAFPWASHYELRAELRVDAASEAVFSNGDPMNASKNQVTGTLAALAYF